MNKKTNKTAHVMSILTKNINNTDNNALSAQDTASPVSLPLEYDDQTVKSTISDNVKLGLLELLDEETTLLTPPILNQDLASNSILNDISTPLNTPPSPAAQSNSPILKSTDNMTAEPAVDIPPPLTKKDDILLDYTVVHQPADKPSYDAPPAPIINPITEAAIDIALLKNIKDFTPEIFFDPDENDKFPESYFTEKEDTTMISYQSSSENKLGDHYICVNVVEEITSAMLKDVMTRFSLCDCERCKADVMAIALNDLTPKYVGTQKGQLYVKLAGYEKQYSTDVLSALTKACIFVKSNPRH